jgi:hypothetical protein
MRALSLLSIAAVITSLASARFFVVRDAKFCRDAAQTCADFGARLARLRSGRHSNIYRATLALSKAKVGEAWVYSLNGHRYNHRLFLRKPSDFKTSDSEGKVIKAKCDADMVCDETRAVLCYLKGKNDPTRRERKKCDKFSSNKSHRSTCKVPTDCNEDGCVENDYHLLLSSPFHSLSFRDIDDVFDENNDYVDDQGTDYGDLYAPKKKPPRRNPNKYY